MEIQKNITLNKGVTIFFFILIVIAIIANFLHFYYYKNYDYLVSVPCDSGNIECSRGECVIGETCEVKVNKYYIKAYNYGQCTGGDCTRICNSDKNICLAI